MNLATPNNPNLWDVFRFLTLTLLWLFLLQPGDIFAHSAAQAEQREQTGTIGLDEHLGTKIPLDLTFRDETGKTVRLGDIITGATLILPVYYRCTNICNYLQVRVANALKYLKDRPGQEFRVISISFDELETPAEAARSKQMYLTAMNSSFPADGWRFLTGERDSIRRLTDAIGYQFERRGQDFIHPVASLVVSRDGTIIRYLYGVTILPKDLALALAEARHGVAGISIRKLVEYCFTYDPVGKTYVFNVLRISASVVIICTGSFLAYLLLSGKSRKSRPRRNDV